MFHKQDGHVLVLLFLALFATPALSLSDANAVPAYAPEPTLDPLLSAPDTLRSGHENSPSDSLTVVAAFQPVTRVAFANLPGAPISTNTPVSVICGDTTNVYYPPSQSLPCRAPSLGISVEHKRYHLILALTSTCAAIAAVGVLIGVVVYKRKATDTAAIIDASRAV